MSLERILREVHLAESRVGRKKGSVRIVAVSKVQPINRIENVLKEGHRLFGENRLQESLEKWPRLMDVYDGIELHLVGPLQTNKTKEAMTLYNAIHSVDREKLIFKIERLAQILGQCPDLFLQVNIGNEPQKTGVDISRLDDIYFLAKEKLSLPVVGLMCIPPVNQVPHIYFEKMAELNKHLGLHRLSMGMSNDFKDAIHAGATEVRIGSALYGERV